MVLRIWLLFLVPMTAFTGSSPILFHVSDSYCRLQQKAFVCKSLQSCQEATVCRPRHITQPYYTSICWNFASCCHPLESHMYLSCFIIRLCYNTKISQWVYCPLAWMALRLLLWGEFVRFEKQILCVADMCLLSLSLLTAIYIHSNGSFLMASLL